MEITVIYEMIKAYIDIGAVASALFLTQAIRYMLPTPIGAAKHEVGPWANKFLTILPVVIGAATVIVKDGLITPTMVLDEAIVKGFVSGGIACWAYKSGKVWFFEKKNNGTKPSSTTPTTP